jgi:phosphoglucosamine mutase
VIVTGSHLDETWNGLKLVAGPSYLPLDVRLLPDPAPAGRRKGSLRADRSAVAEHVAAVLASVDADAVRRAALSVSLAGGTGSVAERMLEALGCRTDSSARDLGLVLDADGDRLELVDEQGNDLDPELTLPLVASARRSRRVVKGADTSSVVDLTVGAWGGTVRSVPTGELHLAQSLLSDGGDLAGEGNGGVIVPAVGLARDGIAAAATILAHIALEEATLSELAASLPSLARRRSTVPCRDQARAAAALEALARSLGVEPEDSNQGLRLDGPGGDWVLVRASGTEPVLRITAEARETERAETLHDEMRAALLAALEGSI